MVLGWGHRSVARSAILELLPVIIAKGDIPRLEGMAAAVRYPLALKGGQVVGDGFAAQVDAKVIEARSGRIGQHSP